MPGSIPTLKAAELHQRLQDGEKLTILDVRNEEDYATWKIESPHPLRMLNVPYVQVIEDEEGFVEKMKGELPKDGETVVVCAHGGASDYIAGLLADAGHDVSHLAGGMAAWGDLYDTKLAVDEDGLQVYQVSRPARGCLSYVVGSNGEAVVIDPLRHIDRYIELAKERGLKIVRVLDTHGHADHISGGRELADVLNVPYHLHPYDAIHPIDVLPATFTYEPLSDGKTFIVGDASIKAVHVPGHTLGNIVYVLNDKYLFSGDSIFVESIARPDLGGRGETWAPIHYRSLNRLLELPDSTIVFPGHFSAPSELNEKGLLAATLGELKAKNEGLQMVTKGESTFTNYILSSLPEFPEQYVDIKRVNAGLLTPDEEKASELELGRNICALSQAYAS